jgi:hypothetical protein
MPGAAPNPLAAYAHTQFGSWVSSPDNVGVRIDATVAAPVPEPSALLMYGVGIIGMGFIARRKLK